MIELAAERGRVRVRLRAHLLGADLWVALTGGDREHIGAVAVSQPRGAKRGRAGGSTTSLIALLGHREDELARSMAARLASRLGVAACVTCGVHVDDIRPEEIRAVQDMAEELTGALLARLQGHDEPSPR